VEPTFGNATGLSDLEFKFCVDISVPMVVVIFWSSLFVVEKFIGSGLSKLTLVKRDLCSSFFWSCDTIKIGVGVLEGGIKMVGGVVVGKLVKF
jgi:hypothetical protein